MNNILTIDDDVIVLETLNAQLSSLGYKTMQACTGSMGLELAETRNPDLILLDLNMPGMNGFEVLKELRKREVTREIPVILLTSISDKFHVIQAKRFGVVDYVLKPYSMDSLMKGFNTARQYALKRKIAQRAPNTRGVLVSRGGRKTVVTFRNNLNEKTRDEAGKVVGPTFRQLSRYDDFILDIRAIESLNSQDIFFLEKLLKDFDPGKLYVAAGRHAETFSEKTCFFESNRIFSSLGEVNSVIERHN